MKYRVKQPYPSKTNKVLHIIPKDVMVENNVARFDGKSITISNKELEILTDWFEKIEEPKFKVGDWVYCDKEYFNSEWADRVFRIKSILNASCSCKLDRPDVSSHEPIPLSKLRLATFEEIQTHLINEARRRGFKAGVTVNFFDGSIDKIRPILPGYSYYETDDVFSFMGWIIYKEGEWAEIIKEKIMVGKYDVLFRDGCIQVGCKTYNVFEVSNLLAAMDGLNINSIEIEGVKVPFETVKKIAERFQ